MSTVASPRFDPFRILSADERAAHLRGYLDHLIERDGQIDAGRRQLARREDWNAELSEKPVEWTGEIDLGGFHSHWRDSGTPEIDQRTAWLLAAAKANLGEAYGVEIELSRFFRDSQRVEDAEPHYLYLMLEEKYHTGILEELCRTCGIEPEPRLPAPLNRLMIHLMTGLPERVRWIAILAGEVLGTEVFALLRQKVGLFDEQPEVAARLETLLREIWIDEVFHVAYLRAKIGPWGIRIAKLLLPLVVWSLMRDVPQLARLGWTRKTALELLRRRIEIPTGSDWMAADPA